MDLVWPGAEYLSAYIHALKQGWSPDNLRPEAASEQLAQIERDPERFLRGQVDREAKGPPVTLPDNSTAPRLPGYCLWMWDRGILWIDRPSMAARQTERGLLSATLAR